MNHVNTSRRDFLKMSLGGIAAAAAGGASIAAELDVERFASEADATARARQMIENDGYCRVIVSGDAIVAKERGRGVRPFISLLDTNKGLLKGGIVVESVVGIAAAAVSIEGGAAKVIARTASEGAKKLLEEAGVALEASVTVPRIMNRTLTGTCPVEDAVKDLSKPGEIIAKARETLARLSAG